MHTFKSVVYHLRKHISIDLNIPGSVIKRRQMGRTEFYLTYPKSETNEACR